MKVQTYFLAVYIVSLLCIFTIVIIVEIKAAWQVASEERVDGLLQDVRRQDTAHQKL